MPNGKLVVETSVFYFTDVLLFFVGASYEYMVNDIYNYLRILIHNF